MNKEFCAHISKYECSEEFQEVADDIMMEEGYTMPETPEEAALLFAQLKDAIDVLKLVHRECTLSISHICN